MAKKNIEVLTAGVEAAAAEVQKAMNALHDAEESHKNGGGKREPVVAALVRLRDANRRHVAAIEAAAPAPPATPTAGPPTASPPAASSPATLPAE